MPHTYHEGLVGYDERNVLHDGCRECEDRAREPLTGLCNIDEPSFARLWDDMTAIRWGTTSRMPRERISSCDLALIHALYTFAVLLERHTGFRPHDVAEFIRARHGSRQAA